MCRSIRGFAAISGLVLAIGLGHAATARAGVNYDTALASPGVYFGSGNGSTHWTVNTQGGVELGLEALIRYTTGAVTPQAGTSIYDVPTGMNASHGGSLWDFAFSANLGTTGLHLSDITTTLTVVDEANGTTGSVDALGFLDNSGYNGTKNCVSTVNSTDTLSSTISCSAATSNLTTDYAFQNAEPLAWGAGSTSADALAIALGDPNFSALQNDTFLVTFSATNSSTGASLGSVSETIVAGTGAPVPEPGDLAILGVGLLGLVVAHRAGRRQARVSARTHH
jgi:hypothetical protein